jgi:glucose/arabinose dehydrogenase/mono/diheme cytochrome c family protein
MKVFSKRDFSPKSLQGVVVCALLAAFLSVFFVQCNPGGGLPKGDPDNGGLFLPGDFEAVVVVDSLKGAARHMAVNSNGDIYVKLRFADSVAGNAALRDTNGDGKADTIKWFDSYIDHSVYGTEMRIHNGYLYFSSVTRVFRQKLTPGKLVPDSPIELLLTDTQRVRQHDTKPVAFDDQGNMYIPFGAPSDCCQVDDRTPFSPGMNPCPILETRSGIWKFDANKPNQFQKDGELYAIGFRSVVGMEWRGGSLFVVAHGRDYLHNTWPNLFTPWQGAVLPSEVFVKLKKGDNAGWPYHYYDQIQEKYFLNPEYGGDGKKQGDVSGLVKPIVGFPGHFAPDDIMFYTGDQFPDRYKEGAFIAFHGSTSSAPYPQSGYFVAFVPFKDGMPSGPWEVFADGFAGHQPVVNVSDATYRPVGLAQGPDGSLYVCDSEKGKIWRIMFKGDKANFGEAQLAAMEKRKHEAPNIKTPDEQKDILTASVQKEAAKFYMLYCSACHQRDGKGDGSRFPPLYESDWVRGDKDKLIGVILHGKEGVITVNGRQYDNQMPKLDMLTDQQIAQILTFVRQNFGNNESEITPEEVAKVRKSSH